MPEIHSGEHIEAGEQGKPMHDEHARSALLARVQLERFEIREVDRELNSVTATATIEADAADAVREFLAVSGPEPWMFAAPASEV
jgi:hypothetical protein